MTRVIKEIISALLVICFLIFFIPFTIGLISMMVLGDSRLQNTYAHRLYYKVMTWEGF